MDDSQQNQEEQGVPEQVTQANPGILNQTFGEVLQNKEAQDKIMQSMHIGPEQFQKLLKSTEDNPMTNMTVGQLFKSGLVQKAVQAQGGGTLDGTQGTEGTEETEGTNGTLEGEQVNGEIVGPQEGSEVDPEQFQEMVDSGNAQVLETDDMGNPTKIAVQQPQSQPQNQSFWDIIKGIFKG
jgi:hypothetical protein